ncbi:MFS transporter [Rhodococcus sp. 114MFTsu3.1]|uniref:MFS transporter n=1 Tax=Rhodococcus sp. 114MFTsu3.1 TaxID=1172184 RepID=UPI0003784A38|nr:MFS transporter [Rhodococcus sp. 114MFTsu3.1]
MSETAGAAYPSASPNPPDRDGTVENEKLSLFQIRLAACAGGSGFIDGYVLSIFGVALLQIGPQFSLSPVAKGAIAATILVGIFFGGVVGGYLSDKFGRQRIYKWDLFAIAVLSVASFWVDGPVALLVMRLLVGFAVGVDYPIGSALLTEFSPKRFRGPLLGVLISLFFLGGAVAYLVGQVLLGTAGDDAWRWMLASAAVPALMIGVLRIGTPESPYWLTRNGRLDEAAAVMERVFGPGVTIDEVPAEGERPVGLFGIVRSGYAGRLAFVIASWTSAIIPVYAIFSFGPQLIGAMNLDGHAATYGSAVIELFFAIGCIAALGIINKVGRRTLTIQSFALKALPLLLLGIFSDAQAVWIAVFFIAFALFSGGLEVMNFVYPNELFPTDLRSSAMGLVTAFTRFGAAAGTFLVPVALDRYGISATMYAACAITLVGLLVSIMWAPETTGMKLSESSSLN